MLIPMQINKAFKACNSNSTFKLSHRPQHDCPNKESTMAHISSISFILD